MSAIRLDREPSDWVRLRWALRRSAAGRAIYRRRWRRRADAIVVSFPKAGRTWLRALLATAFRAHFDHAPGRDLLDLRSLAHDPRIPRVRFKHDDAPQLKRPDELVLEKSEYRDVRVVLLVRDLRDLAVSAYFQMTRRERRFDGEIESFLRGARGGVDTMIRFLNIWSQEREVPKDLLLLRYEDLHRDPAAELGRVLAFLGVDGVSPGTLAASVEASAFDRMRALESTGQQASGRLRPGESDDPESFKTRRGAIGAYHEYLRPEQAAWIESRMRSELDPWYGYPY